MKKGTLKSLPVWAQKTIADLKAAMKVQAVENGELFAADEASHARAITADQNAAAAIKDLTNAQSDVKTLEGKLAQAELDLATLRGYVQRINQQDNAMHGPATRAKLEPGESPIPAKFELPETGHGYSASDTSGLNSYLRNR